MRSILQLTITILIGLFLLSFAPLSAKGKFTVVIDPGHGGYDHGTLHRKGKMDEKAIALSVALRLGKKIESNYKDVTVVYTRKTDVYPSLPDRVKKAKDVKGDLFISIHVNACPTASARGFETYVFGIDGTSDAKKRAEERMIEERENLDVSGRAVNFDSDIDIETKILCQAQREKHNKQSLEVAKAVQTQLMAAIKKTSYASNAKSRGVKSKNLFVLCYAPMPAILVELGYMSNAAEERFISSEAGIESFATGLYRGFADYKAKWDKRQLTQSDKHQVTAPDTPPTPSHAGTQPSHSGTTVTEVRPVTPTPSNGVIWRIQFLTSDKLLKPGARELKGLTGFSYYKEGKIYKYVYGQASSTRELAAEKRRIDKLFPNSFYVKFDSNGNRIK